MVVRLARGDVNMPDYDGFTIKRQVPEVLFEAATYKLLRNEPEIRPSRLLYYRVPILKPGPKTKIPTDFSGRRIFVFERADGTNNVWEQLNAEGRVCIATRSVCSLLNFRLCSLVSLHICVLPCSTIVHLPSLLQSICTAASSISRQILLHCLWRLLANFGFMSESQKSKPQSETRAT
jgi:hypothetical protein